ncbi:MAG: rhomboid family intramembrane serine protease [Phycisphaerales bacterium]|nr:MAG: rhomboid family intramembrane serine protease [Phycisphaerales bacterium]
MLLPLGTDRPLKRPTLVTHGLIGACTLVFIAQMLVAPSGGGNEGDVVRAMDGLVLRPREITPWTFVTYQFLHGDLLHLLGNMLFLWVFGPNVEDRIGRAWFLVFYLLGGVAAGVAHCFVSPNPVVGASGAISAVTGAYLVLFPRTTIRVLLWFFIIGFWRIPATWFIGFAIAKDLFFSLSGGGGEIAFGAHLGGYAFGAGVAIGLLWLRLIPREQYDLFTIGRQAQRRRAFKSVAASGDAPWVANTQRSRVHKKSAKDQAKDDARAKAVSEIVRLVREERIDEAGKAYRAALDEHGPIVLSRGQQLELANRLFAAGDAEAAGIAYDAFLAKHPKDAESPRVRLMLGLISARHLNDPVRAKSLLRDTADAPGLTADERALAATLLSELG